MKKFLNLRIEVLLSALLGLLGFTSCARKVELEKPAEVKKQKDVKKGEKVEHEGLPKTDTEVEPSYRILYGPPPVSFRK